MSTPLRPETELVRFDAAPDDPFHPTTTPIYQTATFKQETPERFGRYDYSRSGNPTRDVLQRVVARLERAQHAHAFASGVAAITGVLGLVHCGQEILAGDDLYGGTFRLLSTSAPQRGIGVTYADPGDPGAFAGAMSPKTRLVHLETPTNPTLKIVDIAAVVEAVGARARALGIERPIVCVDNTLATALLQNPLTHGADVVIHSATKSLNGHGDVTGGVVCVSDAELSQKIGFLMNAEGTALGPMDSFLLLRGIKTLAVRVERQQHNAMHLARELARGGRVERVLYPGLEDHPGHAVHARQSRGPGTMLSLRLGSAERAVRVAQRLKLFTISVSFGAVASSACYPASMSHASIPVALRARVAPPTDLLRVSVGIEDSDDLLADLHAALDA